ncbi:MAG TPA: MFS transporter [Candidatus Dormibacteraeota bacterium]|nr:MFS transporter [Candidatus Dormibacteraeota bacterium]
MRRQRWAVSAAFFCFGTVAGSLVPRMPAFKESLHLTDGQVGLAFLFYAAGAVAGAVLARPILASGARRWVRVLTVVMVGVLIAPALAPSFAFFAAAFFLLGVLGGLIDVLENSQAAEIEREAGRPMINGFHGFWSLGFVAGGAAAAFAAAVGLSPLPHFAIVAVVVGVGSVPLLAGVPDTRGGAATLLPSGTTRLRIGTAVGAVAAMAFFGILVESAGGDWGPIYLRDYGKTTLAVAAAVSVAFSLAMTAVRMTADRLTARTGPAVVVALGALVAIAGVAVAIALPAPVTAITGFTLVGAGCAVMVPLAFSAAANLGRTGTPLSVVLSAGYAGSIVGPWLIGSTADRFGLRLALLIPLAAAGAVLLTALGLRSRAPG